MRIVVASSGLQSILFLPCHRIVETYIIKQSSIELDSETKRDRKSNVNFFLKRDLSEKRKDIKNSRDLSETKKNLILKQR
jgi:hypothetical protein